MRQPRRLTTARQGNITATLGELLALAQIFDPRGGGRRYHQIYIVFAAEGVEEIAQRSVL